LVEAYDPQLGAWAQVAGMSVKRRYHASVVLDGKIYAMGGYAAGGSLDMVEAYDPHADSWQQVASMPRGLYQHAAVAMGGKIYVTGGSYQWESVNSAYVYDPQADGMDAAGKHERRSAASRLRSGGRQALRLRRVRRRQCASQHGGGLRPGFRQLGVSIGLDLRAQ
jgi:hypothetical protein